MGEDTAEVPSCDVCVVPYMCPQLIALRLSALPDFEDQLLAFIVHEFAFEH